MSISRKIKRRTKKEPLSLLDKSIYIFLEILSFSLLLIIGISFGITIPMKIAFSNEMVVAASNSAAIICAMPMMLVLPITINIIASAGMQKKQPIFGNKNFKASLLNPVIRTTPLFSKEFRKELSISTKRKIKKYASIAVALILLATIILPFGFHPRTVLDKNNDFSTYNTFNKKTHTCNINDAEKLIIDIKYSSGGRRSSPSYSIQLLFVFPDKTYNFNFSAFYEMNDEETLKYMLKLKSMFGKDRYEITNAEDISRLIYDKHYNSYETSLIYDLFDYSN